ncbi:MAG: thiamine phosphate synthase [Opitutus sp.]|nr:thiamine phosphate synthase [Opitutus sp.]MCS6246659.1 thiamine phosphate synthase [Opitutus sp.]MCS6272820.1 thiamine phosphate synthase [Opitutus sp.]MCS6278818.1 thiamine phosphate synthase [Opitutus sp.]MCS6299604.1 thiamine phosphate synthase [Opitutus sp.]
MRLIVISPEAEDAREPAVLAELFSAGLTHYHLRKPAWSRAQLATWLRALPESVHARIVLHTHHDLAGEFAVGGIHDRDQPTQPKCHLIGDTLRSSVRLRSRAVHTLSTLRDSLGDYDRLLVSPVFNSISKTGHGPSADFVFTDLKALLSLPRRAEVVALGGIDADRIPSCRDYGFDGVAVLGAVWQAADPVRAFNQLNHACRYAHAA